MIFALYEHPDGVESESGNRIVYDVERNEAHFGAARVDRPAIVWELGGDAGGAAIAVEVELGSETEWLARCDRVDFPPGGVAFRHVHPGPGIRRLLFGELTIDSPEGVRTYGPGGSWLEGADFSVLATASATEETAFVRVLLLPREWGGKRTIRYLDPRDEEKPKRQRATIFLEQPIGP